MGKDTYSYELIVQQARTKEDLRQMVKTFTAKKLIVKYNGILSNFDIFSIIYRQFYSPSAYKINSFKFLTTSF